MPQKEATAFVGRMNTCQLLGARSSGSLGIARLEVRSGRRLRMPIIFISFLEHLPIGLICHRASAYRVQPSKSWQHAIAGKSQMPKVLIVEDDPQLAEEIRNWLELDRYLCEWTSSGVAAIDFIERSLVDLVILDWQLPDVSGIEVLQAVGRGEKNSVPVLMLTGKSSTQDKITGLDSGADDYLTKPFSGEILLAKVRALLRRTDWQALPVFSYGDITLDEASHEVRIAEKNVRLTAAEFACLRYLVQQAKRGPVSIDSLLQRAWSPSDRASTDGVKSCIYKVRTKLKEAGSMVSICMRTGYGYELSEAPDDQQEALAD